MAHEGLDRQTYGEREAKSRSRMLFALLRRPLFKNIEHNANR